MDVTLVVIRGKVNRGEIPFQPPAVMGRSREADLTIAHPMVSRHHCELFEVDGLLMVRDLGSLNGTMIGQRRVVEAALPPDGSFSVGPLTFQVRYAYAGEPDAAPPPKFAEPLAVNPSNSPARPNEAARPTETPSLIDTNPEPAAHASPWADALPAEALPADDLGPWADSSPAGQPPPDRPVSPIPSPVPSPVPSPIPSPAVAGPPGIDFPGSPSQRPAELERFERAEPAETPTPADAIAPSDTIPPAELEPRREPPAKAEKKRFRFWPFGGKGAKAATKTAKPATKPSPPATVFHPTETEVEPQAALPPVFFAAPAADEPSADEPSADEPAAGELAAGELADPAAAADPSTDEPAAASGPFMPEFRFETGEDDRSSL